MRIIQAILSTISLVLGQATLPFVYRWYINLLQPAFGATVGLDIVLFIVSLGYLVMVVYLRARVFDKSL